MDEPARDRTSVDELAQLADELLRQATDVRRQWVELGETLGLEPAPQPRAGAAADPPAVDANAQLAEADPVRLVALDMMLSGRSRDEVSDYLRATFGEEVGDDVLDEIFSEPAD